MTSSPDIKPQKYNWLSGQFHWLIAAMIIAMFALAWTMEPLPLSKEKLNFYSWHKWLGIIILGLVSARLIWRLFTKAPSSQHPNVPGFMNIFAHLGHVALYLLLFIIPILGWLRSSTAGYQVVLFETIPLPNLMAKDQELSKLFSELHEITAFALLFLLAGHIGAVILHHVKFKDPVLLKMQPATIHRLLLALTLIGGAVFYANYTYLNPPPKMEKAAEKQQENKKVSDSINDTKNHKTNDKTSVKSSEQASKWSIVKAESKLEFTATQKGAATTGSFEKFSLKKLNFDAANPDQAEVEIEIEVSSLSVGNLMVEQTLVTSSWFDASDFPKASFRAKNFKPLNENERKNKYILEGELTIKNITKPLTVPLTITEQPAKADKPASLVAIGEATISRLAYEIGQGEWASTEAINDEVLLKIHITAVNQN